MIEKRVEKHVIKESDPSFIMLLSFCHLAKNLYNHANFMVRDRFFHEKKWLRYQELDKLLREDTEYPDYKEMPTAQTAQQVLRMLDKNWKSFFKAIKDWKKNKGKYLGRPKPPKYLKKDGYFNLVLTNQNCKLKEGKIRFPKVFSGFTLNVKCVARKDFVSFQQVRFIPHKTRIVAEVVYNVELPEPKTDNGRYIAIDPGVNNLATVCNNIEKEAFIINGRPLKSINQFYNKRLAELKSATQKVNGKDWSNAMDRLTRKRNARISNYLHKVSRFIVGYCKENDIHTIVFGINKNWKQDIPKDKTDKFNQNFVQLPFKLFIDMIKYKANEFGMTVIVTEESYTSGTSFIDGEEPVKKYYNNKRRVHRGLFVSDKGMTINADLNGAYQILKKVFPIKWDRGCVLHPSVVRLN